MTLFDMEFIDNYISQEGTPSITVDDQTPTRMTDVLDNVTVDSNNNSSSKLYTCDRCKKNHIQIKPLIKGSWLHTLVGGISAPDVSKFFIQNITLVTIYYPMTMLSISRTSNVTRLIKQEED